MGAMMIERLEMAEGIYKGTLYAAHFDGKVEGITEGKIKERISIAGNALQMGIPIADISRLVGLSESEIKELAH